MSELRLDLLCIPPVLVTRLHGHLGEVFLTTLIRKDTLLVCYGVFLFSFFVLFCFLKAEGLPSNVLSQLMSFDTDLSEL